MKTTLKSTIAALSFAILAAFAFSSCANHGSGSGNGTHLMMQGKSPTLMPDKGMASGHR